MSKRFADAQGGSARYGGSEMPDTPDDPPRKATAAQLAKRNIKPMKGRSTASRSTSPSKPLASPSMNGSSNPFGGVAPMQQPQFGGSNTFGGPPQNAPGQFGSSTFGPPQQQQSAPTPPVASSFTFGASAPASNPFASSQTTSQSFPAFGAPQQSNAPPTFSPAKTVSFDFGGGASTNAPSSALSAPFAFSGGSAPVKPAERNSAKMPNPAATMFGTPAKSPADSAAPLTDAEIKEIEDAGPRLASEGKLAALEQFVRDRCPKYKNAPSLDGFSPRELVGNAQRDMLDFVRGKQTSASTAPQPSFSSQPAPAAAAAPTNPFASLSPAPKPSGLGQSMFGDASSKTASSTPFKAPETASAPFQFGGSTPFGPQAPQQSSTPAPTFKGFGSNQTPEASPAAGSFAAKVAPASSAPSSAGTTQASAPPSLFTSNSQQATPKPASSIFPSSGEQATPKPTMSFGGSNTAQDATPKPSASIFTSDTTQQATPKAAFSFTSNTTQQATPKAPISFGSNTAQQATPKPSITFGSNAAPQATPKAPVNPNTTNTQQAAPKVPAALSLKNRELNEAIRKHLSSQDPSTDWSHIMRQFLEEHKKIVNNARVDAIPDPASRPTTSHNNQEFASFRASAQAKAPTPTSDFPNKRKADEESDRDDVGKRTKATTDFSQSLSSPNKPYSQTASLFNDILDTPAKQTNLPPAVPATAPAAPSFGNFTPAAPKIAAEPAETPKANPFANLQKASSTPAAPPAAAETPKANPFANLPKANNTPAAASFSFKPSTAAEPAKTPAAASTASAFSFKPSAPSAPTPSGAPAFALPKFGGGGGGSSSAPNFLSAFGARAADEEKKEREKRKLEDMDSDDDEEEWERKDAEEQAAKRKKMIEDAAAAKAPVFGAPATSTEKSGASVFKFGSTKPAAPTPNKSTSSSNIFGHLSGKQNEQDDHESEEEADAEADEATTPAPATSSTKSLFDRVEKPTNGDKPAAAASPSTGFKFTSNTNPTSPAGDQTWNGSSSTPIKFGGLSKSTESGTTTPTGSPAKATFGGFSTASSSQPPVFGGLFGAKPGEVSKPSDSTNASASPAANGLSASIFSNSSKPSTGFTFGTPNAGSTLSAPAPASGLTFGGSNTSSIFGSAATSRGSTPATTDAENSGQDASAEGEPSDEQKDVQQGDLTALTAEERANNEVLFEGKAKASQFTKATDDAASNTWVPKGLGILRILKDKNTGKHWVLLRSSPGGRVLLNFGLLGKDVKNAYAAQSKIARVLVAGEGGVMQTWALNMKDVERVSEFVDKLEAGRP